MAGDIRGTNTRFSSSRALQSRPNSRGIDWLKSREDLSVGGNSKRELKPLLKEGLLELVPWSTFGKTPGRAPPLLGSLIRGDMPLDEEERRVHSITNSY